MRLEIELKLSVAAADAGRIAEAPVVRGHTAGEVRTVRLTNTYFDTPDHALRERGYGLRLRHGAGRWWQTVKRSGRGAAGLSRRREWECEVEGGELALTRFRDPELRAVVDDPAIEGRLGPVFVSEFERVMRELEFGDGTRIELAVDVGTIRAGAARRPLSEVELELKRGRAGRVFETARALHDVVPLRVETRSKARRGYDLVQGAGPPAAVKAEPLAAAEGPDAGAAFRAVLRHGVDHLLRNEPAAAENPDAGEAGGEMRKAARQLAVGLDRHQALIPEGLRGAVASGARWLAEALDRYRLQAVVQSPRFTAFILDVGRVIHE